MLSYQSHTVIPHIIGVLMLHIGGVCMGHDIINILVVLKGNITAGSKVGP
jgi:hypothetical protein